LIDCKKCKSRERADQLIEKEIEKWSNNMKKDLSKERKEEIKNDQDKSNDTDVL